MQVTLIIIIFYLVNTKHNCYLEYARKDPLQQLIYRCCHGHTKYLIVGLNLGVHYKRLRSSICNINYLRILEGLKVKVFVLWLFYSIEYFKLALLFHSYPIIYSGIMDTYLVMLCYFTSKIFIHVNC